MVTTTLRQLLEAGVHFGHQAGRWNPKMKPFIFAKRNGIYIIDLQRTRSAWQEALQYLEQEAAQGGKILFVGTKRQAQNIIAEEARRCGQYFVNYRWLGGLLTNWQTISKSIDRYRDLEAMTEDGRADLLPKKEVLRLRRELVKLERNLIGIRDMGGLPDVVFVIDVRRERIAVDEALKLGIPVVAVVDTNCDPEGIEYVVPGNDDAIRSIRLFCSVAADAILTGRNTYDERVTQAAQEKAEKAAAKAAAQDKKGGDSGKGGQSASGKQSGGGAPGKPAAEAAKPADQGEPKKEAAPEGDGAVDAAPEPEASADAKEDGAASEEE